MAHKVITGNPGGIVLGGTPVPQSGPLVTLPWWWGKIDFVKIDYGDIRFPLSAAIAPDQLLPVCFGAVRVGGSEIQFGAIPGEELFRGRGVIAWCEGEIEAVDALYIDGQPAPPAYTDAWVARTITHYTGASGDSRQDGAGQIFYGKNTDNFGAVAYTFIDIHTLASTPLGGGWMGFLPPMQGAQYEWAADVRALKIYDPRLDSTNGGSGSQRYADPTTWTYSNNPVLIARYLIKKYGHVTDIRIDDVSFSTFATAADTAGFTCNVEFASKSLLSAALAIVLQTCNGKLVPSNGKTGIYCDLPNTGDPIATLSEEAGDIWGLEYEWLSARDRYTRMAVSFFNQAASKQDVTPDFDHPGIALGTIPIRPIVVNAPGINTLDAAVILRDYLFNSQAVSFRVTGMMNARGISFAQGQKIRLKTLKGVDVDCLFEQISGDDAGFFSFVLKPYDEDVFGTTPITQGPPIFPPTGFVNSPLPDEIAFPVLTASPASVYWKAPRSMDAGHAPTLSGGYGVVDLGAGVTAKMGKFVSRVGAGLAFNVTAVEWSDDGSSWTAVSGLVAISWRRKVAPSTDDPIVGEWTTPTLAHRYWRGTASGVSSGRWADSRFYGVLAEVDPDIDHYEVFNSSALVDGDEFGDYDPTVGPLWLPLPAAALPTATSPLDLKDIISVHTLAGGYSSVPMLGPYIVVVRKNGTRSPEGVWLIVANAVGSTAAGPGIVAAAEAALPGLSAAGSFIVAMDESDHVVKMSADGSAFAPIGSGATGPPGPPGADGTTSPLTTKGDLWGFDTADNRIPVGTNGYVLAADSTEALGVKYKDLSVIYADIDEIDIGKALALIRGWPLP